MVSKWRSFFPDPRTADETGIVAAGGELSTELILDAYYHGIFPWPHDGFPLLWFSPPERGVLDFDEIHIPKSLEKFRKKTSYVFTHNGAFVDVIGFCAHVPRKNQTGTWINFEMRKAYTKLHELGHAHSFECWDGKNLVGGVYGVFYKGVFSGESMFSLKPNTSKLALLFAIEWLETQGLDWMDVQMVTSVTGLLGAKLIPRSEYLNRILKAHKIFLVGKGES